MPGSKKNGKISDGVLRNYIASFLQKSTFSSVLLCRTTRFASENADDIEFTLSYLYEAESDEFRELIFVFVRIKCTDWDTSNTLSYQQRSIKLVKHKNTIVYFNLFLLKCQFFGFLGIELFLLIINCSNNNCVTWKIFGNMPSLI